MAEVKSNDSIGRTLLVVLVLCLVCSVVVAGSAVGLKARQQEQKALDKQRNILDVAGLATPKMTGEDVKTIYESRITPRLLDLKSGELLDKDSSKFDQAAALRDPEQSVTLSSSEDRAGIKHRSNIVEIYLVRDEQNKVKEVVLPVYGKGLWSMMYAFVSLQTDGRTVKGITYYDQGETPGLGGEVENPNWRAQWIGKKLLDDNGQPALRVVKGGARQGDEYSVDGLSGATLTANGVQHTFDFWMGELGFGPFLKQVREGALNNG
ncbi:MULTISPECIES: Na(+)-translocating NADH-quinone reductase subunit C [Buttiauxella]|uniref:Na(+)-translocating NADH-quinone reductase subunit C n=1 Tax=Buttiauxella agrestis ATCC 33320 TaxID=1006004 RepID=A0A085GIS1_9ENTR|nr:MULTISPECIES: Na(+)-translocating NADH-quinone reductase subunit C [Buttiauxella]KFC83616.1 Na(+)-translocating NADH-quinone reductase subunit C [Buttiauxella agrestis ATCC 33320]MCS3603986.1 Na+-transporting NADH:ubiquinone oxidoreductase subunit C [Buttiauxella sp. BIGb0471]BCG10617.1 NADH:ubiquinone reductase (Na(+)-transporting) subunit C [Buttiauxella agrestis]